MSLVAAVPASEISGAYLTFAGIGGSGRPALAGAWESAYFKYSATGIVPIATGPAAGGIINAGLLSIDGYASANVDALANMFASYWATSHLIPVPPAISIAGNDALTKVEDFRAAILASYTNTESTPYFEVFLTNIETVVKTIIWTGATITGPIIGTIS